MSCLEQSSALPIINFFRILKISFFKQFNFFRYLNLILHISEYLSLVKDKKKDAERRFFGDCAIKFP